MSIFQGGVRRSKRQTAAALEKSMDMYNFEDEAMNDENQKLSFTSPKNACKAKSKSGGNVTSVGKSDTTENRREITQKTGKGHFLHLSKSPSFEFFSKKQCKVRKSDSGIFMTPSPVLKDFSNSPRHNPKSPKLSKHNLNQPAQICKEELVKIKSVLTKKGTKNQTTPDEKQKTLNVEDKKEIKCKIHEETKDRKSVSFDKQILPEGTDCFADDVKNSRKPTSSKKTRHKDQASSQQKMKKSPAESSVRTTRSSSDFSSAASVTQQGSRKVPKAPLHSQKLRSVKTRQSTARKDEVKKPTSFRNTSSKLFKQHINITKMVEENNRKHKIMTAPTSTPINLRPRTPKGVKDNLTDVVTQIHMDLPEVSPVIKCGSHGAVVASPGNLSGLGSPRLKPNIKTTGKTRVPAKPVKSKNKMVGASQKESLNKKNEKVNNGSLLKYACKTETAKRKQNTDLDDKEPKRKKVATSKSPSLTEQKESYEQEQQDLSMNLFEYSPEKAVKRKKKMTNVKPTPVEVEATHSSLDISRLLLLLSALVTLNRSIVNVNKP